MKQTCKYFRSSWYCLITISSFPRWIVGRYYQRRVYGNNTLSVHSCKRRTRTRMRKVRKQANVHSTIILPATFLFCPSPRGYIAARETPDFWNGRHPTSISFPVRSKWMSTHTHFRMTRNNTDFAFTPLEQNCNQLWVKKQLFKKKFYNMKNDFFFVSSNLLYWACKTVISA